MPGEVSDENIISSFVKIKITCYFYERKDHVAMVT